MKVARHQISNRPKRGARHKRDLMKARMRKLYWEQECRRNNTRWPWENVFRLLMGAIFGSILMLLFLTRGLW